MFRRMSSILVAVSMIAVLIIASWAIGLTSADTPPKQAGVEPVEVSQGDPAGVTVAETNVSVDRPELRIANRSAVSIPVDEGAEAERLRAYLQWKHNATPGEAHEIAASERLLDYLRWKHNVAPIEKPVTGEAEQLQNYLRWKHNTLDSPRPEAVAESERLLGYLRWKHQAGPDLANEAATSAAVN